MATALTHQADVADELKCVAIPLLRMEQDGLTVEWRPVPGRLEIQTPAGHFLLDLQAPFQFFPTGLEVTQSEPVLAKVVVCLSQLGIKPNGLMKTRLRAVKTA